MEPISSEGKMKLINEIICVFLIFLIFFLCLFIGLQMVNLEKQIKRSDVVIDSLENTIEYLTTNECQKIILTAYTSHHSQTDDTPDITASGSRTSFQTLALSQDLISHYNRLDTLGIHFGDTVKVVIVKDCIVEDIMNLRFTNRADIWTVDYDDAIEFGVNEAFLIYEKAEGKR